MYVNLYVCSQPCKMPVRFSQSIWMHWITQEPPDEFFVEYNIGKYYEKLSNNLSFHIGHTYLMITFMKTFIHFCMYLAKYSPDREMFQTNVVRTIEPCI